MMRCQRRQSSNTMFIIIMMECKSRVRIKSSVIRISFNQFLFSFVSVRIDKTMKRYNWSEISYYFIITALVQNVWQFAFCTQFKKLTKGMC